LYPGAKYDSMAPYLGIPASVHNKSDNPLIIYYIVDEYFGAGMDVYYRRLRVILNSEKEVVEAFLEED